MNMMQQAEIQNIVNPFYDEQGRAERIKNFPFPENLPVTVLFLLAFSSSYGHLVLYRNFPKPEKI